MNADELSLTEPLHTPVLLLLFNRPDTTRQVMAAIRQVRPPRLYLAADGPRPHQPGEAALCEATREAALALIDWPCEVLTLFQPTNLNCGVAPTRAITWFFEHEEAGIILEDDCLPAPGFFWFCQQMLHRYRHDTRVMHISGNNFQGNWQRDPDYSYYFSRHLLMWGWASWRRAWQHFDFQLSSFPELQRKNYVADLLPDGLATRYLQRKFEQVWAHARTRQPDIWDYQWHYAILVQAGLTIVPHANLVCNIGFGPDATHTFNRFDHTANVALSELPVPLRHPPMVVADHVSDGRYFRRFLRSKVESKLRQLLARVRVAPLPPAAGPPAEVLAPPAVAVPT
jgi:hypothetical protein